MEKLKPKRLFLALSVVFLLLIPSQSQALQDSFAKPIPGHRTVTLVGMNAEVTVESRLWHRFYSVEPGNDSIETSSDCGAIGSSVCPIEMRAGWYSSYNAETLLPLCDQATVGFCVEEVAIFSTDSNDEVTTTFLGSAEGQSFSAQPEFDLPKGGTPLIFSAPQVPHTGGKTTYAVIASLNSGCSQPKFVCVHNEFQLVIQPFSGRNGLLDYKAGERFDFSKGTRVKLAIQVPKSVGGWFTGRVGDPTISVSTLDAKPDSMRIEINAASLEVNRISANVPNEVLTPQMEALSMEPSLNAGIESGSQHAVDWVEELRPFVNDAAIGSVNVWQLKSVYIPNKACYPPGELHGLVTTNAVAYSWNPPEFLDGYLDYRVAGLHFNKDASLAKGTYDLIVNSNTARCLYGYSNAPVSATVQVVGDQGAENIATTIVAEKDGWLKLAAYGFTFSEKEIKVKLTQPYSKTITKFAGSSQALSSQQKAEIKEAVTKGKNNPKFICTGTYVSASSKSTALARARATCNYAKSLDKDHSYFAQAKQTTAKSYDAKVMITSK